MDINKQRPSSAIPKIRIELVEDDDLGAELNRIPQKSKIHKKRYSLPEEYLSIPNEKEILKKSYEDAKRPLSPKKDLTKGIGMFKILESIEKRKIKEARRARRRSEDKSAIEGLTE